MAQTTTDRVAAFRSRHPITVIEVDDPHLGRISRCEHDGLRVNQLRDGRWRHDSREVVALLDEEYGGTWIRKQADEVERRIERLAASVDIDEDEDRFDNREGQPEFNGSFR